MARPVGSSNSKECESCGSRVVLKPYPPRFPGETDREYLYNYNRQAGRVTTRHTCSVWYNGIKRDRPAIEGQPTTDTTPTNPLEAPAGESEKTEGEGQPTEAKEGTEGEQPTDETGRDDNKESDQTPATPDQIEGEGKESDTPPTDDGKLVTTAGIHNEGPNEFAHRIKNEALAATTGIFTELFNTIKIPEGMTPEMVSEQIKEAVKGLQPREHKITIEVTDRPTIEFEGQPHKDFQLIARILTLRHHLWLAGGAGAGKTTVAEQVAKALGLAYQEISCGPATDQWDLFGYKSPDGRYIEGKIREVFEFGGVLMLDEVDNASDSVLVAMNSALANGHATFPDGRVKKHKDFVCIAGANTFGRGADRMYVGRNQLDGATLDRFSFLPFDYDEEAEFSWAAGKAPGCDSWVKYVQAVRQAAMERQLRVIVSPRASLFGAEKLAAGFTFQEAADLQIWNKMDADDKEMLQACVPMAPYAQIYREDN